MIEELVLAFGLAVLGMLALVASAIGPWILVIVFGTSVDAPSVWFFQVLPAFGAACLALAGLLYFVAKKKKK